MRIMDEVRVKVAGNSDQFSKSITQAVHENVPAIEIVRMLAEQADCNYRAIADLIGTKLTNECLNLFGGNTGAAAVAGRLVRVRSLMVALQYDDPRRDDGVDRQR